MNQPKMPSTTSASPSVKRPCIVLKSKNGESMGRFAGVVVVPGCTGRTSGFCCTGGVVPVSPSFCGFLVPNMLGVRESEEACGV